jgi:tetratricopeptide (TPR) repeat protein
VVIGAVTLVEELARPVAETRRRSAGGPPWRRLSRTLRPSVAALVCLAASAVLLASCGGQPASNTAAVNSLMEAGFRAQTSGNLARADADYLAVVKADPHDTLAWYDLGVIAGQRKAYSTAATDYRNAIAADGRYVPALYNLAIIVTPSDPKLAAALYLRCTQAQPGDARAYLNLGFVERTLGYAQLGRADIAKAVKLDPSLAGRQAG